MKGLGASALAVALCAATGVAAQSGMPFGFPGMGPGGGPGGGMGGGIPGMPDMGRMPTQQMTPEEAQKWADEMMLKLGESLGVDPEAMRNAPPEKRNRLLQEGADAYSSRMIEGIEQRMGMSVEEWKAMSEAERDARAREMFAPPAPVLEDIPLDPAPPAAFRDGSEPLAVGPDQVAVLRVEEEAGRDYLLVASDASARRVVMREDRTAPFEERIALKGLAPDPNALVIELIDPNSRRVVRRFRPVAAE